MHMADCSCRQDLAKSKAALELRTAEAVAKAVQSAQHQLQPVVERLKQEAAARKEQDKKEEVTGGSCAVLCTLCCAVLCQPGLCGVMPKSVVAFTYHTCHDTPTWPPLFCDAAMLCHPVLCCPTFCCAMYPKQPACEGQKRKGVQRRHKPKSI